MRGAAAVCQDRRYLAAYESYPPLFAVSHRYVAALFALFWLRATRAENSPH